MADEKENTKTEAQDPERTDGGIYAGVEKYTKEDHPEDNVAYDPATGKQTGAGVPPSTSELSHRSETNGRDTIGQEPIRSAGGPPTAGKPGQLSLEPDEITKLAVHPAPAPSREHLIENYPHIFPKLEKQAEEDEKRKEEEEETEARKREKAEKDSTSGSDSSSDEDSSQATTDDKKKKKHHKHNLDHAHDDPNCPIGPDGHHHRTPLQVVAHTLHLDRHDRRIEKEQKLEEKEEMRARKKNIQARDARLEHGVNELTQTEASSRPDEAVEDAPPPKSKLTASEGGAVSDSKSANSEAIPLEMLNPEGLERKAREEEVLQRGGDLEELAYRDTEERVIPADRVDNLIRVEKQRRAAGLPVEEDDSKKLRVNFHTADSMDKLDEMK